MPTDEEDDRGPPKEDLREAETMPEVAGDPGKDAGRLTEGVQRARKRLARKRTKRKAKRIKRKQQIRKSDPVQAAKEVKKLGEESPVARAGASAATAVGEGAKRVAKGAVDVATGSDGDDGDDEDDESGPSMIDRLEAGAETMAGNQQFIDSDGDGRADFLDADGDGRPETPVPRPPARTTGGGTTRNGLIIEEAEISIETPAATDLFGGAGRSTGGGRRSRSRSRSRDAPQFDAFLADRDAEPMDRNPVVDSFLDRDPDGDERDTGPDRALGAFDIF